MKIYGVATDIGVGDIIEGVSWKSEHNTFYISNYVNVNKPDLGLIWTEVFYVFTIYRNNIKVISN